MGEPPTQEKLDKLLVGIHRESGTMAFMIHRDNLIEMIELAKLGLLWKEIPQERTVRVGK